MSADVHAVYEIGLYEGDVVLDTPTGRCPRDARDGWTGMIPPHQRQTCKACGRADKFDFHVPDEVWAAVVPPELVKLVVCLFCFDEFARQNGVSYAKHIEHLYFAGDRGSFTFVVEHATDVV